MPERSDSRRGCSALTSRLPAALPEVKALCLWGDMRTICLLNADIGMGGHASVTAADTCVACAIQTRCSVFKIESGAVFPRRTSEVHLVLVHNTLDDNTIHLIVMWFAHLVQVLSSCAFSYSIADGTLL